MARTEEKKGQWRLRYVCHCGKVYSVASIFSDGYYISNEPPDNAYLCSECGCKKSFVEEKGRYNYIITYKFFGNKESEPVWEAWVGCPHV